MGYDLLAAIGFAILTPIVLFGFAAYWFFTHRERALVEDAWRAYAEARGLDFEEASGEWPNRTSPELRWTVGEARCELRTLGKESRAHTRLVIHPGPKLLGTLVAVARNATTLQVRSHPSVLADRLLTEDLRRALLAFGSGGAVSLAYRRGRVVIEWRGREQNDARLDEARRLADLVPAAVEAAFHAAAAA